jgi:hypothetical protein
MRQIFLGESFPGKSFPGETFLEEIFSGESYPMETFPGDTFPGENFPGEFFQGNREMHFPISCASDCEHDEDSFPCPSRGPDEVLEYLGRLEPCIIERSFPSATRLLKG